MVDEFVLLNSGDFLLLNSGDKVILNSLIVSQKSGGGGTPRKVRPKELIFQEWPITGPLFFEENMQIIANLLRDEVTEANGFLLQEQIVEAVGRLGVIESFDLNCKLKHTDSFKIRESNKSKYQILLDILREL